MRHDPPAPKSRRRGSISYSAERPLRPWYWFALEPALLAANLAAATVIYPAWRTARIRWETSPFAFFAGLREAARPTFLYSWHANELLCLCAFRDVSPQHMPVAIGHDGPTSRMLQRAAAWFGIRIWVYRRGAAVRPKEQILEMIRRTSRAVAIFPDAGGPDRKIREGFPEIARQANGLLIPFVVHGSRVLTVRGPSRYSVPLPFCRIAMRFGPPLEGLTATAARCQAALESLETLTAQA